MAHLALNTVIPPLMQTRYQIALGIAPIGLMFASFIPGFLVASRLDDSKDVSPIIAASPTGLMWVTLFIASMVVLMEVGYALGWLVNHAVARWILGWPASEIKAIFGRSEVPNHWLKPGAVAGLDAEARSLADWEQQRSSGPVRYILQRGVLAWGLPMFAALYVVPTLTRGQAFVGKTLLFNAALWLVAGACFGAAIWFSSEANYRKLKKRLEA